MKQSRIDFLDIARGIGILLVIAGHSTLLTGNEINFLSGFHMPLFFILAGILYGIKNMGREKIDLIDYLKKRCRNLLLPYVIFSIINILFSLEIMIRSGTTIEQSGLMKMFMNFITLRGISVLWFLPTLFMAEVILLFFDRIFKKKKNTGILLGMVLVFILLLFINGERPVLFLLLRACLGFFFLGLGTLLSRGYIYLNGRRNYRKEAQKIKGPNVIQRILMLFGGGAILFLTYQLTLRTNGSDMNYMIWDDFLYFLLTAVLGSMGVIAVSIAGADMKWLEPIRWCGVHSMFLYLTHLDLRVINFSLKGSAYITGALHLEGISLLQKIIVILLILFFEGLLYLIWEKIKNTKPPC